MGLGPADTNLALSHSFVNYVYNNLSLTNHSLQYRKLANGTKEIVFGLFGHTSAKIKFKVEKVHDFLNTMRIDVSQINLGNHSFPTHLGNSTNSTTFEDPKWMRCNMILGEEPYLTIETPYIDELDSFEVYLNQTYPEIRILR